MKTNFIRLLALMVVVGSAWVSSSAHAVTKQDLINSVTAKTDAEVFSLLTSTGVGKCSIGDAASCPTCACHYYFYTNLQGHQGFYGAPVYNSDNSTASAYNGSVSASRMTYIPAKPVDSTGCFAGPGGLKTDASYVFQGNNTDEGGLSKEAYAKKVLLRMMADSADPCALDAYIAALPSGGNAYSVESMIQDQSNQFVFSNATGSVNPKDCRKVVSTGGGGGTVTTPQGFFSPTICMIIYRRLLARDGSVTTTSGGGATMLPSNSPVFRSAISNMRKGRLSTFAATNPLAFDPASVQTGSCAGTCTPSTTFQVSTWIAPLTSSNALSATVQGSTY